MGTRHKLPGSEAVLEVSVQVLTIGKISAAVVLAGAAYQDEAGYARMTGLPPDKTRLIDDRDGADTQVCCLPATKCPAFTTCPL